MMASIVDDPQTPAWIAQSDWRAAGWEAGWLAYWQKCLDACDYDIEATKALWAHHQDEAQRVIEASQLPAAEGAGHFGTRSCWENSARHAVAALNIS